ncbi:MAG: hypothetical protein HEP71_02795 [Roseivirga sp.]|nr:hypothetical protein [Roseivirga sp.]
MIKPFLILSLLTLTVMINAQTRIVEQEKKVFENELGSERIEALNSLVESFNLLLSSNFSEETTAGVRITRFLEQLTEQKKDFVYDDNNIQNALKRIDSSGFRKDIYLFDTEVDSYSHKDISVFFDHEEERKSLALPDLNADFEELEKVIDLTIEPIDTRIDNRMNFNTEGLFLYAMAKAKEKDTTFMQGLKTLWRYGDTSPTLLLHGQQSMTIAEKASWEYKALVAILIYYPMIWKRFSD